MVGRHYLDTSISCFVLGFSQSLQAEFQVNEPRRVQAADTDTSGTDTYIYLVNGMQKASFKTNYKELMLIV